MERKLTFEKLPEAVEVLTKEVYELKQIILKQKEVPTFQDEKLLNIKEAAELINLSTSTIYTKVSKGELPVMKRGKKLYFSKDELLSYIKEGRRKTNAELETEAHQILLKKKKGGNYERY